MPRPFMHVRREGHPTTPALVVVNDVFADPPLYTTRSEPQIVQQLAVPSIHSDLSGITLRTRPRPGWAHCHVHRQSVATLLSLIPSSDSPEARICANVYSVALRVPV